MKHPVKFIFLVVLIFALFITGCSNAIDGQSIHKNQNTAAQSENSIPGMQESTAEEFSENGTLKVHFINVGQADSILVQLPGDQNILIDAGNNDDADLVVNYLRQQGIKKLDHVIGTHPHEDHVGGLDVVIQSFDIGKVYLPRVAHNTKTYEDVLLAVKNKGLKVTQAKAGVELDASPDVKAIFLAPNSSEYDDLNNYSAVLKLIYDSTSFLFTGDAEAESEQEMLLSSWQNPKADVLKVGHHGSHSSTTEAFLKAVGPEYAIISVGKDNDYGHPHAETLAKLAAAGVQVFRTDQDGTIVATSDGKTITISKKGTLAKESVLNTSSVPSKAPANVSSSRSVEIINIDLEGEIVSIKNTGSGPVDLSGWKLVSQKGDQVFNFPAGTVIAEGNTLKVMSGPGAQAGLNSLVWTNKYIWNNRGDPGILYDSNGNIVSRFPR